MINTEKLEKILKKKKDRIPALLEVLKLTGKLCKIDDDDNFNNAVNIALDKVEYLLSLQSQSKKTAGQILTASDYKELGIFENHIKKLRRKSKQSQKADKLAKIMPKLYEIKKSMTYSDLQRFFELKYKIKVSRTYFLKIFKKINNI